MPLLEELENTLNIELDTKTQSNPTIENPEDPNIVRGYDRYQPDPKYRPEAFVQPPYDKMVQSEIHAKQIDLDSILVLRAKNILVEHNFRPFDLSNGRVIEDYIRDSINKERIAQFAANRKAARAINNSLIPAAAARGSKEATNLVDYGSVDLEYLMARAEAHDYIADEIEFSSNPVAAALGETIVPAELLMPTYIDRAKEWATKEIQAMAEEEERVAQAKLKRIQDTITQFEQVKDVQGIDPETLERVISGFTETKGELEATIQELKARVAQLESELESRDFSLWEAENTFSDEKVDA